MKTVFIEDFDKEKFMAYLQRFNISDDLIVHAINEFSDRTKAISKYNTDWKPGTTVFTKIDENLFEKEIVKAIDAIAGSIAGNYLHQKDGNG